MIEIIKNIIAGIILLLIILLPTSIVMLVAYTIATWEYGVFLMLALIVLGFLYFLGKFIRIFLTYMAPGTGWKFFIK